MTVIEIKPHRNGWKVFEAPGIEPFFPEKNQAINYAQNRDGFARVRSAFWIQAAMSNARFRSRKRIKNYNAGAPSAASAG
jgi:hypothetical protein